MMTKQRIRWSLLSLLALTGLAISARLWYQSTTLTPPVLYIAPLAGEVDTPLQAGTPEANAYFDQLLTDPNIQKTGLGITVVSHGWIEKDDWYQDLALTLRAKTTEPWLFAWFDWQDQSKHANPAEVARLAKFKLGPELGRAIGDIPVPIRHVHLIGHSAGSWLTNEAAKAILKKQDCSLHLTFLDAYIPAGWNDDELGDVSLNPTHPQSSIWADHYLTHDHTLGFTHHTLKHAYNVDLTSIAHGMNRHRFPFYWYHATVTGQYPREKYAKHPLINQIGTIRFGFPLTREAGLRNWQLALTFVTGNIPIDLAEPND